MLKKLALISLIIPTSSWAYQFEGSLGYTQGKTTDDEEYIDYNRENQQYSSMLSYYFSPVNANRYPLDRLAFSQQISSLSIYQVRNKTEYEDTDEAKTDHNGAMLRGVFANKLIFLAEQDEYEGSGTKLETVNLGLGYYFNDLQEVSAVYSKSDTDYQDDYTGDIETTSFALRYEGLLPFKNGHHLGIGAQYSEEMDKDITRSISIDAGGDGLRDRQEEEDLSKEYSIAVTYYPMQAFGVGLSYSRTTNDKMNLDSYQAEAKYYFTPSFALKGGAEYRSVNPNRDNYLATETHTLFATASFRF